MVMTNIIAGIVLTLIVLVLSLVTISKGYGFKHSIDELPREDKEEKENQDQNEDQDKRSHES